MFRATVLSLSAVGLLATPAFAGSYAPAPAEPEVIAPVVVSEPGFDWTGAYVGGSLGGTNLDPTADDNVLAYGIHGGYDYDFGTFVLGGEGEYQHRDMWHNNAADSARLKVRAGYDMGRTLLYGVGGLSQIDGENGYNLGVGGEYMVTDTVSLGAEYLYENISGYTRSGGDLTGNTVAARVNYRF